MQIAPVCRIKIAISAPIEIWNVCDIHLGCANCDEDLLVRVIAAIRRNPRVWWVATGDICECISPHDQRRFDPRSLAKWINRDDIRELVSIQLTKAKEYLVPIKEQCLGVCVGNHEEAATKYYGIPTGTALALALDAPYLDYYGAIPIVLECGTARHRITLVATHGHGGSITPGAILNVLVRACERHADTDIVFMGHLHRNLEWVEERVGFTSSEGGGKETIRTRSVRTVAVMSGGFYRGYYPGIPSYAEKHGHRPTALGVNGVQINIHRFRRDSRLCDEVYIRPIQPQY